MTNDNPEQEARAAVEHEAAVMATEFMGWWSLPDAKFKAALGRLCTERYLAGKVEALKRLDSPPAHSRTLTLQIHDAEAEYAACVAALREAK